MMVSKQMRQPQRRVVYERFNGRPFLIYIRDPAFLWNPHAVIYARIALMFTSNVVNFSALMDHCRESRNKELRWAEVIPPFRDCSDNFFSKRSTIISDSSKSQKIVFNELFHSMMDSFIISQCSLTCFYSKGKKVINICLNRILSIKFDENSQCVGDKVKKIWLA